VKKRRRCTPAWAVTEKGTIRVNEDLNTASLFVQMFARNAKNSAKPSVSRAFGAAASAAETHNIVRSGRRYGRYRTRRSDSKQLVCASELPAGADSTRSSPRKSYCKSSVGRQMKESAANSIWFLAPYHEGGGSGLSTRRQRPSQVEANFVMASDAEHSESSPLANPPFRARREHLVSKQALIPEKLKVVFAARKGQRNGPSRLPAAVPLVFRARGFSFAGTADNSGAGYRVKESSAR